MKLSRDNVSELEIKRVTRLHSEDEIRAAYRFGDRLRVEWMKARQHQRNAGGDGRTPAVWTRGRRAAENSTFSYIFALLKLNTLSSEEVAARVVALEEENRRLPRKEIEPEAFRHLVAELVEDEVRRVHPPQLKQKPIEPEAFRHLVAELVEDETSKMPALVEERVVSALDRLELPAPEPGLAEAMIDDAGELVLTRTDGKLLKPGRVKSADGAILDSLEIDTPDGGRTLVFRMQSGGREIERKLTTEVIIDRGVWKAPGVYKTGDLVTYAGSAWVAERDAPDRPGIGSSSGWRLAVKRGRDGRGNSRR